MKGKQAQVQWSTRIALILASIAMIVGTGNIWRFPRMLAENGGGSFLVGWFIFLFLWSLPLIMIEMVIGRKNKMGPIGSFKKYVGKNYTWMGAFIVWVAAAATFYTSVVTGFTLKYLVLAIKGAFTGQEDIDTHVIWENFSSSSLDVITFHILVAFISGFIVYKGINKGIETSNMIFVPLLFVILIFTTVYTLTLDGAVEGVKYMFTPQWEYLSESKTWLDALSQSAWSTGAGWGVFATYAIYTRKNEDIAQNSMTSVLGNNSIELLAGITILGSIFALSPNSAFINEALGSDNTGLIFIYVAGIFGTIPGGYWLSLAFFLALALAAVSSLVALFEVVSRNIADLGIPKKKAVVFTVLLTFVLGIPSALNMTFLNNQDSVWGMGLVINAILFWFVAMKYGVEKVKDEINEVSDIKVGKLFVLTVTYCIPLIFVVFFGWWMYQSVAANPGTWMSPFKLFSLGTVVTQLGISIAILFIANRWLSKNARSSVLEEKERLQKLGKGKSEVI